MDMLHENAVPLTSFSTKKQKGWLLENRYVSVHAIEEVDGSVYLSARWGNDPNVDKHTFHTWAEAREYLAERLSAFEGQ